MTARPSRTLVADVVLGVVVPAVLWACFFAGLILVVPGYKKNFTDFNLRLPDATLAVIAVADWAVNYWYVLVLSLPVFLAADVAVVVRLQRSGRRGLVGLWEGVMIALPLLAAALVFVAIHLAVTSLLEGLSK
jgi:type II secretory pathway component PulF